MANLVGGQRVSGKDGCLGGREKFWPIPIRVFRDIRGGVRFRMMNNEWGVSEEGGDYD